MYGKRRHEDEQGDESFVDPLVNLQTTIFHLGDPITRGIQGEDTPRLVAEEDIKRVVDIIKRELDRNPDWLTHVMEAIVGGALVMPHKTALYAVMTALLYSGKPQVGQMAVEMAAQELLDSEVSCSLLFGQFVRWILELGNCRVIEEELVDAFLKELEDQDSVRLAKNWSKNNPDLTHSSLAFDQTIDALIPLQDIPLPIDRLKDYGDKHLAVIGFLDYSTTSPHLSNEQAYRWLDVIVEVFELNHHKTCELIFLALPQQEPLLVNYLFSALLDVSSTSIKVNRSQVLLINSCKMSRAFAPTMIKALKVIMNEGHLLYDGVIDHIRVTRLAEWFALHLTQFDFKWPWDAWQGLLTNEDKVDQQVQNARKTFLTLAIDRLHRLSYAERLEQVLSTEFRSLVDARHYTLERETFKYAGEDDEHTRSLLEALRNRASCEEVLNATKGDVDRLVHCLLFLGCRTLSHTMAILERYSDALNAFDAISVISSVVNYYYDSICLQPCELVIQKLIHQGVLKSSTVLEWMNMREQFSMNIVRMIVERESSVVDAIHAYTNDPSNGAWWRCTSRYIHQ